MERIVRIRYCNQCNRLVDALLVRNITANGVSQVYWLHIIERHSIKKNGLSIPHELVRSVSIDPDELPVENNYSGNKLCEVCQSPFTDEHHWMPKHLVGDEESERWPKGHLCKKHHNQWHAIVTPLMAKAETKWIPTKSLSQISNLEAS